MIDPSGVRFHVGASSWVRRFLSPRKLRRSAFALGAALALAATATTPAAASPDQREGSGAGALVEYQTNQVVEGRSVTATVRVFVVVPKNRSLPKYLAVGVKEIDDRTGAELFAGTGTGQPGKFTVGANFVTAHVTGQITVQSATSADTRVADVDVVWSPQHRTEKLQPGAGAVVQAPDEGHKGVVRRMTGFGIVTISDPARTGYVITISTPGLGCAWLTKDTSSDMPPPLTKRDASDGSHSGGAKSTTTGHWSGYWTWTWTGTQWVSKWTWVWVYDTAGGYAVS